MSITLRLTPFRSVSLLSRMTVALRARRARFVNDNRQEADVDADNASIAFALLEGVSV